MANKTANREIQYAAPAMDWETRAYWEGCGRHELVLQRCRDCKTVQHRPRALCVSCFSDAIEHFSASGRGVVHTFTVIQQNGLPAFRDACPYVLAYVALEEGPQNRLRGLTPGIPRELGYVAPGTR